ncbi:MAG: fucose isomerase [Oscillospiraceae bacterium]|nr:fucose isomerase [Oscillospiraceae bacterium]
MMNFGVIVTTRSFFSSELAKTERNNILDKLKLEGHGAIIPDIDATFAGSVSSYDDAKVYSEYFKKHVDEIDGIIVVLANFGDETSVAETIQRSNLSVPILILACDDETDKLDLARRRDAFCGKISLCNNLYQRNIKFTTTKIHTLKINSDVMTEELIRFSGVCRVVKGLKNLRIAAIGARPDAFHTVRFSEKILQASGITTVVTDLSEIIAKANSFDDENAISSKINEIKSYGQVSSKISDVKLRNQAKLCIVIENFIKENDCSASAIQCWNSIQYNYGCATCTAMSMMGEKGMPSACEMDVTGALTMYSLYLASSIPSGYLDWNNNFDEDRNMCINLHCSNFPKSFFGNNDIEIENLDVLSTTIDVGKCFGACKGRVSPGEMTFAKITTDDKNGKIKVYIGEGEFIEHNIDTKGGVALCKIDNLQELLNYICKNGFEHHVSMARGHVADILEEAFSNYMGFQVYRHK